MLRVTQHTYSDREGVIFLQAGRSEVPGGYVYLPYVHISMVAWR